MHYECKPIDIIATYGLVPGSGEEEMLKVLDLIVAEFRSDPMSVQCFDERIVQRASAIVDKYNRSLSKFKRRNKRR